MSWINNNLLATSSKFDFYIEVYIMFRNMKFKMNAVIQNSNKL